MITSDDTVTKMLKDDCKNACETDARNRAVTVYAALPANGSAEDAGLDASDLDASLDADAASSD